MSTKNEEYIEETGNEIFRCRECGREIVSPQHHACPVDSLSRDRYTLTCAGARNISTLMSMSQMNGV
jgi:tRNA(Ile2) C34 agmatinyltransferase TiaS